MRGWVTATAAAWSEARAKARVSQQLRQRLWQRLRRGWRARAWVTAATTAAARGADTPAMRAALDVLAHLPMDNDDDDKFADVGGGGGRGRWPGDRRRDDHRSAIHPCCDMSGTVLRRGRKWNVLNIKQLGKVRVIIFENICNNCTSGSDVLHFWEKVIFCFTPTELLTGSQVT